MAMLQLLNFAAATTQTSNDSSTQDGDHMYDVRRRLTPHLQLAELIWGVRNSSRLNKGGKESLRVKLEKVYHNGE